MQTNIIQDSLSLTPEVNKTCTQTRERRTKYAICIQICTKVQYLTHLHSILGILQIHNEMPSLWLLKLDISLLVHRPERGEQMYAQM